MPARAESRCLRRGPLPPGPRRRLWLGLVLVVVGGAISPLQAGSPDQAGSGPTSNADAAATFEATVELLRRMAAALREVEYEGTLVYLHDRQLNSLRIAHRIDGGESRESVLALSGPIRALSRNRRGVTCVLPDARAIQVRRSDGGGSLQRGVPADPARLQPHYLLHPLGQSRVAGRITDVIGIIPRDNFRYGYRFHVDRETSLPLKTELMDTEAQPIEQVMFTELQLFDTAPSAPPPSAPPEAAARSGRTRLGRAAAAAAAPDSAADPATRQVQATQRAGGARDLAGESDWVFVGLPPGFEVVARSMEPLGLVPAPIATPPPGPLPDPHQAAPSSRPLAVNRSRGGAPEPAQTRPGPPAQAHKNSAGTQEHLLLSDGLASVSVYIEPATNPGLDGTTRMGAVHAAGREIKQHRVTAVGEVPAATVATILDAVRHR